VTESVVEAAAVPRLKQAGFGRELRIDVAGLEEAEEGVPGIEGEAEPESLDHLGIEAAVVRQLATDLAAGRIGKNVGVEGGGELVELDEPVPVGVDLGGDRRDLRQLDAGPPG
jgi:hypothetical protein